MTEPTDAELDAVLCKHWPAFSMQVTLVRMWVRAAMRDAIAKWDTPPAEQQATKETSGGFHGWRDISTAPKDGSRFVATGHNYGLYSEVRHTCVAQWFRGCWMETSDWNETSELKYLTHWMPLPSPPDDVAAPAEQQAAPKVAPAWEHHARKLTQWLHCMSHNDSYFGEPAGLVKQVTGELNRLIGAAPQPVAQQGAADGFFLLLPQRPKPEAPAGTAGLDWDAYSGAQMLAFGRDCSDAANAALRTQQPAPATQQAGDVVAYLDVGANGYLDLGSELSEDALKQLPKGRHALVIAGTYGIDGYVAAPQPSPTTKPAPEQEAQEPCGWTTGITWRPDTRLQSEQVIKITRDTQPKYGYTTPIYTAPQPAPAPAPLSDDIVKDAARYRLLRRGRHWSVIDGIGNDLLRAEALDAAVDAAIAAQGGKA